MAHCIETRCETDEERRDAVLYHLLNGICITQQDVPPCKSLGRDLPSTMHLSHEICTLLLSAHKHKQLTRSVFRLCCMSLDLKTSGPDHERDLSRKLQQRLTRWAPLYDSGTAVDAISRIESFGSGSLLELAALHGICFGVTIPDKDGLCNAIVRHLILGKCRTTSAALCTSICSTLLPPIEPDVPTDLGLVLLDVVIDLGIKKTLRRALDCIGITHAPADPISVLRSLLRQHRDELLVRGQPRSQCNGHSTPSTRVFGNIVDNWPQRVPHSDKARIVRDFRTATSSNKLKTVSCASCAERVHAEDVSNQLVAGFNLDVLRSSLSVSNQTETAPPLPYVDGPLGGILVDPTGVHRDEDGALYLSLCRPCRNALLRKKLPRFALANLNVIGTVPPELQSLTLVEELIVSRCRAKMCIVKLQDRSDDVDLPTVQRGVKGHIIVFPQHPENLPDVMPPSISDIISPICIIFCGSTIPTPQWLKEKARPLVVRREVVLHALRWLCVHNVLYHNVIIDLDRISALPDNDVLSYHIEQVEASTAARTLVSRYDLSNGHSTEPSPDNSVQFESVLITDIDANSPSYKLKAAALQHAKRGGSFIQIPHDPNPVNEFSNPAMFPMLYPTLFPYGIGGFENRCRFIPIGFENHVKHMLALNDKRFQEHYSFMFVAFNVIQRRKLLLHTSLRVNRKNFSDWAQKFVNVSVDTMQELAERSSNGSQPTATTDDEQQALDLLKEVKLISGNIPGSAASRLIMRNEIRANILSLGVPSFYLTVNPADVYNPIVRFLAGNDIDIDNLLSHEIPTYWDQAKVVARNPCIAATFFHTYINAFVSAILGYDPKQRSITPGILGVTRAYYGCTEAQGRGSLHCHMVVWVHGGMTSDQIRARATAEVAWRDRLVEFLDDTVCNVVPADPDPSMTVQSSEHHPCAVRGIDMNADPSAEETLKASLKDLRNVVMESQRHSHTGTCYKYSSSGEKTCRFGLDENNVTPATFFDEETGSLVLRHLDGMVNNYNPTIALGTRCNGDIKFMASGDAAKSVLFYITDYITKNQLKSHVSFSALEVALKKLGDRDPTDTDIVLRAKKMLQKCVYSIISHQELSGQQVAAYLSGYGDHYSSQKYRNLYWTAFERSVEADAPSPECYCPGSGVQDRDGLSSPQKPVVDDGSDETSSTDLADCTGTDDDTDEDEDVTVVATQKGTVVQCSTQVHDYRFRSPGLSHFSVWDFVSQVDKVKKPSGLHDVNDGADEGDHSESSDDDSADEPVHEGGLQDPQYLHRTQNGENSKTFLLSPEHIQSDGKAQRLRSDPSSYYIPVPIGPALPRRDRPELLQKYCRLMLILFKPWCTVEDLRLPDQTWADAFSEFMETAQSGVKTVLENMQVLHECHDAKDLEDRRRRDARRDNIQLGRSRRNEVEQFAGDVIEDELLNHIDSVVNYASDRRSRVNGDVIECLRELDQSGIYLGSGDSQDQVEGLADSVDDPLPENIPHEDIWRAAYDSRRNMWKQKLCTPPETSITPEQTQNHPTVSNLDAVRVPNVTSIGSRQPPPSVNIDEIIMKWGLNVEQARAFSLIARHAQQTQVSEPMKMYIGGPGGTGKSRVIAALTDYFAQRGESRRLRLTSFTGIAAKNINGTTLHTALALNQFQKNRKRGNGKTKANLIAMWIGVDYLFIDEISMIGCALLLQIHEALVDAKGCTEPFGGVNVIFAGDFAQLPPVSQTKLFSRVKSAKETTIFGQLLWRSVTTVVMLTQQMRQGGAGNERFVEMLSRLRDGRCTRDDYDLLNDRLLSNALDIRLQPRWQHAPVVVYTNAIKDAINLKATMAFARRTGQQIHWYHAVDTYCGKPIEDQEISNLLDTLPSNKTGGRVRSLPLVLGMPVVVTENFDVAGGIVNGSAGILRKVRYRVDGADKRYITSCIVQLPDVTADALPNLPLGHIAVLPNETEMKPLHHPSSGRSCTLRRYQVPLDAGFATTAHKVQGQTLERVVVDLASCIGTEAAYVMVSRCTSLDGLMVLRPFPIGKIKVHRSQEARDEFRRLDGLNTQTVDEHGDHTTGDVGPSTVCETRPGEEVSQIATLFSGANLLDIGSASQLLNQLWGANGGGGMSPLTLPRSYLYLVTVQLTIHTGPNRNKRKVPYPDSANEHAPKRAKDS